MSETERWTRKDAALGLFFAIVGFLMIVYAILARRNGFLFGVWGSGFLGLFFLLIGGNAVYRSIHSSEDRDDDSDAEG